MMGAECESAFYGPAAPVEDRYSRSIRSIDRIAAVEAVLGMMCRLVADESSPSFASS